MLERQQEAYRVAGVDETAPALDPRKRKAADVEAVSSITTILRRHTG